MKYMGSKARFVKEIIPIILHERKSNQWYVEPFAGGMNVIEHVGGDVIASDNNKNNSYDDFTIGWVGFMGSANGKFFEGGYSGKSKTKLGTIRDYISESIRNIEKQIPKMKEVVFKYSDYIDLDIPSNSIIYCDIPYEGTTQYTMSKNFNYTMFWSWVKDMTRKGHKLFVSEYNAPDEFKCVWEKKTKSSLSSNGKTGGNKQSIEKLYTI